MYRVFLYNVLNKFGGYIYCTYIAVVKNKKVKVMDNEKLDEFKKELGALLQKYNADIYSIITGDTHGIDYEALVIDFDNKEVMRFEDSEISQHSFK